MDDFFATPLTLLHQAMELFTDVTILIVLTGNLASSLESTLKKVQRLRKSLGRKQVSRSRD